MADDLKKPHTPKAIVTDAISAQEPAPPHQQTYTVRPGVTATVEQVAVQSPVVSDAERKAQAKAERAKQEEAKSEVTMPYFISPFETLAKNSTVGTRKLPTDDE